MGDLLQNPQGTGPQAVPMRNGSATGGGSKPSKPAQPAVRLQKSSRPADPQKIRG